jgi:hypothetical protein
VGGFTENTPTDCDSRISDQNRCRLESTALMPCYRRAELGRNHAFHVLRRILPSHRVFKCFDIFSDVNRRVGDQGFGSHAESAKKLSSAGAL